MSYSCKYSVALPHSVKGWSAEFDYGISSSYCFGQTKQVVKKMYFEAIVDDR